MKRCCRNCILWDLDSATKGGRVLRVSYTLAWCGWKPPEEAIRLALPESVAPIDLSPKMMAGSYGKNCKAFIPRTASTANPKP